MENRTIDSLRSEGRRLLRGEYPDFVYGRETVTPGREYLPIFTFHTLEPDDFEAKLRYLRDNAYRTLTMDEALKHVRGEESAGDRAVILTVDDGRRSTWTVGYPLLRRYGMHATAFVIPAFLEEGPPRPTLDDESPAAGTGTPRVREESDAGTVLRWSEVEVLDASDAVDVQSHTWMHRRVTVSRRLEGFVTPDRTRAHYDLPCPVDTATPEEAAEGAWAPGAPIFEHAPMLAVETALEPPDAMIEACVDRVRTVGTDEFFRRPDWRSRLRTVLEGCPDEFRRVELKPHQRRELEKAKHQLQERLDTNAIRHLCLPSGRGCDRTVWLAREVGYESVLWGHRPADRTNRRGADPFNLGRVKHDYIFRLPGSRRRSLLRILAGKAARRVRGDTGY